MIGITFGNIHTYDYFGLIQNSKVIGEAPVKTSTVDVDGADGVLDYTEYFGEAKFQNRTLTIYYSILPPADVLSVYADVKNALHGKKFNIYLDDDPGYYYVGRVTLSALTIENNVIGSFAILCDCEPYKLKVTETIITKSVSGSLTFYLENDRKPVVPTITTDSEMTIAFGSSSFTPSAGTFQIPELELHEGNTEISVTGAGTITFKYREGRL